MTMDIETIEQENDKVPKVKKRYDICKQCDKFTEEKLCFQCGCFMPLKVRKIDAYCPLGKWLQEKE